MKPASIHVTGLLLTTALAACGSTPPQEAKAPLTLDTHVDIPLDYMREPRFDVGGDSALRVDLGKMRRGGLDSAFFVIYVGQGKLDASGYADAVAQAERKYSAIDLMLENYADRIRLARAPDEVLANRAAGHLSAMIGIENAYSLGHELARLDAAYARGARYVGLVHVGTNDVCTSSQPNTELGVRDVLAASAAPIIASHSSARALVDHPRNLPDDLLRAIAAKGGVVQAVAYKEFLKVDPARKAAEEALGNEVARLAGDAEYDSEKHDDLPAYVEGMRRIDADHPLATLDDFLDHVEHIAKTAGIDHVGIASDFDGGGAVTGWMDASQTQNVTDGLRRRGFDDADIAKIWSGNLLRVWREADRVGREVQRGDRR